MKHWRDILFDNGFEEHYHIHVGMRIIKTALAVFICGLIGGACAGATASLLQLAGTGMGITVIPGMLLYMDRLPAYLLVNFIGLSVAFILTVVCFKPEE